MLWVVFPIDFSRSAPSFCALTSLCLFLTSFLGWWVFSERLPLLTKWPQSSSPCSLMQCMLFCFFYYSCYHSLPCSIVISVCFPSGFRTPSELRLLFCAMFSHPQYRPVQGGFSKCHLNQCMNEIAFPCPVCCVVMQTRWIQNFGLLDLAETRQGVFEGAIPALKTEIAFNLVENTCQPSL